MIDDLLGIQVEKRQEDYFKTNNLISLGARHTQSYYENNEIPEEEEVNINIPDSSTSNNLHIAYIEGSRRGKTRLSKNIILQLQQFGYHILVIEPKINEWIKARYNGQGSWFHPTQKNTKIKLINYVPSYLESKIPQDQKHLYKLFSPNILSFENPEDWASIGVSEVASEVISAFVIKSLREKTSISLDIIESMIKKSRRLQSGTSNSALTAINNLRNVGFFSYSDINFKQNWEDGFAIIVSFPGGEGSRMNVIIDKLVKKIESIGVYEKLNNLEITRKMIAFEDCSYYATSSDSTSDPPPFAAANSFFACSMSSNCCGFVVTIWSSVYEATTLTAACFCPAKNIPSPTPDSSKRYFSPSVSRNVF